MPDYFTYLYAASADLPMRTSVHVEVTKLYDEPFSGVEHQLEVALLSLLREIVKHLPQQASLHDIAVWVLDMMQKIGGNVHNVRVSEGGRAVIVVLDLNARDE